MPIELPGDDPRNFKLSPFVAMEEKQMFCAPMPAGPPKEISIIPDHDTGDFSLTKHFHFYDSDGKINWIRRLTTIEGRVTGYLKRG